MTHRVLFVASLHHPEQLQRERVAAQQQGQPPPLFPTSTSQHFLIKAMQRRGYEVDVFWRNLPAYGRDDISALKSHVATERITPRRVLNAALNRLPPQANPDYRKRNANLIAHGRRFQPDIVWLVGDNTVIYPETLAQLKAETNCTLMYVTGTSPIVFSHAIERQAARLYDWVLTNDYYHGIQWLELGAKQMQALPFVAIDPDFHHRQALPDDERARYACDVTFVGTVVPQSLYSERIAALEALRHVELGIWSVHDMPETLKPYARGYALGGQMMRVLSAATISLNTHGDFMRYGGNMRLFEAAAVGAFQIVDDRPAARHWFTPGDHLVIYRDLNDLRELVAYYLAHADERRAIAEAARQHVITHHTYEQRLDAIERLLSGIADLKGVDGGIC